MDIFQFYELSRSRSGVALMPYYDTPSARFAISTRYGNLVFDKNDGSLEIHYSPTKFKDFTDGFFTPTLQYNYSPNFTGDFKIKALLGLRDVYSIQLGSGGNTNSQKYNIQDIETFFKQFPNLYSVRFGIYAYQVPISVIKGDLSKLPNSVEIVRLDNLETINAPTDVVLNFSNYEVNSKLKYFYCSLFSNPNSIKVLGDLSKLPLGVNHFLIAKVSAGSAITYTAGKVWASNLDTLSIPLSLGNFLEADALFTDMGNYITSAVGGKVISIGGWVTQKSLTQRTYLTGLDFALSGFLDTSIGTASSTTQKFIGDIAQIPSDVTFFKILQVASGSAITYTAGKVWASNLETLSLPLPLTTSELDNLLIDMQNSVTSFGAGIYALDGVRSSVSDAAVAYLQGLGRTVNIARITDTVLKTPLAANLLDTSTYLNHATMVGTETHSLGGLVTSTGNYAYIPNKTSLDFGTGSLYFGCKVKFNAAPTPSTGIIGKTIAAGTAGRFGININAAGAIMALSQLGSNIENTTPASAYADGNFHAIEVICNRTTGNQHLYIDGVLINTVSFTPSNNNVALNARFHIGAYGNGAGTGILANSEFNGVIKDVFVHKF